MFAWQQISHMEAMADDPQVVLNKAAFNESFLVYSKNLMYGTDVLSCLNKAQNNNQRYVYNNYYGTDTETIGADARAEYFIDVEVKLKSYLTEGLSVYYRDASGKSNRIIGKASSPIETNFSDKLFNGNVNGFKMPTVIYYYFTNGKLQKASESYADAMWSRASMSKDRTIQQLLSNSEYLKTSFGNESTYHLLSGTGIEGTTTSVEARKESAQLAALLSTVNLMEQTIINPVPPTTYNNSDWYSATWKTASYDFKTRKFKCTGFEYNDDTGYINKISFEEIDTK